MLISACADKVPFKEQEAPRDGALVYIYLPIHAGSDEGYDVSDYSIRINNKLYKQRIEQGEYIALELKPESTDISVTRRAIEEKVIHLDLKVAELYYLKITDNMQGATFAFEHVKSEVALKEIVKTGLAGSTLKSSKDKITELISSDNNESIDSEKDSQPLKQTTTKTDEIQKAYEMKEKGIISEEEFQALKTNILSK